MELNDDHTIQAVRVEGGCNGNLQGISRLVVGMDAQEAIRRMRASSAASSPPPVPTSWPQRWSRRCSRVKRHVPVF